MPSYPTVRFAALAPLALSFCLLLPSCGDDGGTPTDQDPPRATSVALDPGSVSFDALGATRQFTATVRDQSGDVMAGASVAWSTSNSTIAQVSSSGLVSAIGNGSTTIIAISGTVSDTADVTVAQVADGVEISTATVVLSGPGEATNLAAVVKDRNGHPVSSQDVVWSSSDGSVATIVGTTVTAVSYGSALITATSGSAADTIGVSVAKLLGGEAPAVMEIPADGEISLFLPGTPDLHIDISALNGSGGPLQGGTFGYGGLDPLHLVMDGPPGGGSPFIPTFLSGSASFLFGGGSTSPPLSSGPNPAGTQVVSVTTTTVTEAEAIQAGSKVGDGIFRADDSRWEWRTSDRWCMTYQEVAQRYLDHWVSWTQQSYAGLIVGVEGGVGTPVTFSLRGSAFGGIGAEALGAELARVTSDALDLPSPLSATDRSQVRIELGGDADLLPPSPLSSEGYIIIQSDPTDLYCTGGVPEAMTVDLPIAVGGTGTNLTVDVTVTSIWGNGVSGVPVTFAAAPGHGFINGSTQQVVPTDSEGLAQAPWTLPGEAGFYQLTASASGPGGPLAGSPTTVQGQAISTTIPTGVIRSTITAGTSHTCGINLAGEAFCWGANGSGQLGDGSTTTHRTPEAVSGGLVFSDLAAGSAHTCGITTGGVVYCWGKNFRGALGDGSGEDSSVPVPVLSELLFSQVDAGWDHTCALNMSGEAYCWGGNFAGRLGDGTQVDQDHPTRVLGGHVFSEISAGGNHTCGTTATGDLLCWGLNNHGQLGTGGRDNSALPTAAVGSHVFRHVTAGADHTCAVTNTFDSYCFGNNDAGQLGSGQAGLPESSVPVLVAGGFQIAQIGSYHRHTCAFTTDGDAYCWGEGGGGKLGIGESGGNRDAPAMVLGGLVFHQIVGGGAHSCGLTGAGEAYCWGGGELGQLGAGGTIGATEPVMVSGGITWASGG